MSGSRRLHGTPDEDAVCDGCGCSPCGCRGPQGATGAQGEKGDKGDKGDTGAQGATGGTEGVATYSALVFGNRLLAPGPAGTVSSLSPGYSDTTAPLIADLRGDIAIPFPGVLERMVVLHNKPAGPGEPPTRYDLYVNDAPTIPPSFVILSPSDPIHADTMNVPVLAETLIGVRTTKPLGQVNGAEGIVVSIRVRATPVL